MSVVAFITDFGTVDWFVGSMKAVVLSIDRGFQFVDITHDVPAGDVAGGRYWQQLRVVLDHDDAPSTETVTIDLPAGVALEDTDGDGGLFDEVRVVYRAVDTELPRFQAATVTDAQRDDTPSSTEISAAALCLTAFWTASCAIRNSARAMSAGKWASLSGTLHWTCKP